MPEILAGALVRTDDRPAAAFEQDTTTITNITSTSYIAGSPVVDVTFTAPTSGRVSVTVGGGVRDNSAGSGNRVWLAPEVRVDDVSGAVVLAADAEARGISSGVFSLLSNEFHYYSRRRLLTGLTAGGTYYARVMYRVTGGTTCDVSAREIGVIPA